MSFVITLIAKNLTAEQVQMVATALAIKNIELREIHWLKQGEACELITNHHPQSTMHDALRGSEIDAIIQPYPKPKYKLLISDMDSTMIEQECIDELADFAGKKKEIAEITHRAMNGELVFEDTLRERVALLAGLPESVLQQCFDERVKLMAGAKKLVSHMKQSGGHTVLVSGGFTFFTSRVRQALGMDEDYSNRLEIKEGKLTGSVIPPILGKQAKLDTLQKKCDELKISHAEVLAIGDGANDLPMLLAAGLGVAYHAKPNVRAQAKALINHCDLSALIYVILGGT